jgi:hypothetical protein
MPFLCHGSTERLSGAQDVVVLSNQEEGADSDATKKLLRWLASKFEFDFARSQEPNPNLFGASSHKHNRERM